MLTQHAPTTLIPATSPPIVQTGPQFFCPVCGWPVNGLLPWPVNPANSCRLDEWAAHIWYLRRSCGCRTGGRVARLGDCITSLEFTYDHSVPYEQRVEANIAALRAALNLIAVTAMTGAMPQTRTVGEPCRGDGNGHAP